MARYDKYEPKAGGTRAKLAADLAATSKTGNGNPVGFGINAQGLAVPGAGANTGIVGLVSTTSDLKAGDVVDIMTDGDIVEVAATAGIRMVADTVTGAVTSALDDPPDATHVVVGFTVEVGRLVVRVPVKATA